MSSLAPSRRPRPIPVPLPSTGRFAAIDFETADYGRDSACAVGVVVVEGDRVVEELSCLIRPPRRDIIFSYLHGITWEMVADQRVFGDVWRELESLLAGVDFLAAHNAGFDRSVLIHGCHLAGLAVPAADFLCTVKLARKAFGLTEAKLPDVCRHLGIGLATHHEALADARACAGIVVEARRRGLPLEAKLGPYSGKLPGR
jgi:DNA polymerase-3 subunit epsilon